MIDNTFEKLNKISKLHFYDNQLNDDNKTTFHNKNKANSNKIYHNKPYNNREKESWRKQKVDLSENGSNNSRQHQFTSKHINQNKSSEKPSDLNIKPSKSQHKVTDYNFKLPIKKSIEPINSLNNSDNIKTKLNKFEKKFSSSSNLHVVSLENNSINKPFSSGTRGRDHKIYGGNNSCWRTHQDDPQNQDSFEIFHNNGINSQHSQGYKNTYPKNQQDEKLKHKFGNRPHLSNSPCNKDIGNTEN